MKRTLIGMVVLAVLAGLMVPATGQPAEQAERIGELTITADYVGVTTDGQVPDPDETGSVTFTLTDDESSEVLWASSVDALDEEVTARWTGPLTDQQLTEVKDYLAARVIVCTVSAD